jgi:hypothetical protein
VFRTADPACTPEEFAALAGEVGDWPRAYSIAERELATLEVWKRLRQADVRVPDQVATAFRMSALQTDLRMQQLARRLEQTARVLAGQGIPFLLLKGAAVGAIVDPTFRARPMTDIDLLVHREDAERAGRALLEAGWSVTANPVYLEMLREAHHLPHFVDPRLPGMRLELHVSLLPDDQPFALVESALWRDSRPAEAPFSGASIPSPEHLALHICVHFAWMHTMNFGAWRTFRAISEVTRAGNLDWERFTVEATEAKAGTSCYWTLRLAAAMSGVPNPDGVLARLAPPTPEWIRAALQRHFVASLVAGEGPTSPSVRLTRWLWRAALRPGWSGHRDPGRWDPERRWERAYGIASTETFAQRLVRHAGGYRRWQEFLAGTLFR